MIDKVPFGKTGHQSTRVIFGAAALGGMKQDKADQVLETLLEFGINHIDTAASYGESELRVASMDARASQALLPCHQDGRSDLRRRARQSHRSLERLRVDQVDLIQLHNLVDEKEWQTALGPHGALEAMVEARVQGTGALHRSDRSRHARRRDASPKPRALRFRLGAVSLQLHHDGHPQYNADVEALLKLCNERGVATQTIKSVARRRWQNGTERKFSWYEPLRDRDAIRRAVHFVLSRPGLFLNTSSDTTILRTILEAASESPSQPARAEMEADIARYEMEPLFIPGVSETI